MYSPIYGWGKNCGWEAWFSEVRGVCTKARPFGREGLLRVIASLAVLFTFLKRFSRGYPEELPNCGQNLFE